MNDQSVIYANCCHNYELCFQLMINPYCRATLPQADVAYYLLSSFPKSVLLFFYMYAPVLYDKGNLNFQL
jgi:hypothetical protein